MRVVVVGATGNVGTSLLEALAVEDRVTDVLGLARRLPGLRIAKTTFATADIATDDLEPHLRGADVVVHLAWLIQPGRDEPLLQRVNVGGSARLFDAAARAGVKAIVYSSSIGAYAPGPKDRGVDESWSTAGVPSSMYSRHKAAVERILDGFEAVHPDIRVVRMRPGLVFKREAASGVRRLFIGPLLPSPLLRRGLIPILPAPDRARVQAVHSKDLGDAFRRAVVSDVRGAFNVAADPVLDIQEIARLLGARTVPVPARVIRAAADATFRAHLQPTEPGWLDLGLTVPIMDVGRARRELGWSPRRTSSEAFLELFAGLRDSAGLDTPPLAPDSGGPLRLRELLTGAGGKSR